MYYNRLFIIDDDPACRRMLANIVEKDKLGELIAERENGTGAVEAILQTNPDIVMIDLLLPDSDGISIVEGLRINGYSGGIIMISQVENKQMVSKAYDMGIEFYITKPVNKTEVGSVLRRVIETQKLQRSLSAVRETIRILDMPEHQNHIQEKLLPNLRTLALERLADMGISGEPGAYDLVKILEHLWGLNKEQRVPDVFRLKDLFVEINGTDNATERNIKAFEQRVRRAVKHAMTNISALGLEDYQNPIFERYAHRFFDFNEVRRRMREISGKETQNNARIDLRRFINALMIDIAQDNKSNSL